MIHVPSILLGMFICYLLWVWNQRSRDRYVFELELKVADRDFEKEMLLDFEEKLIREREQMESDLEDSRSMLAAHLEHFECRLVLSDDTPIYVDEELATK